MDDLFGNITEWLKGAFASANIGDILSGGINFYGQQEAAEAYERAAQGQLDLNRKLIQQMRNDLEPYRTQGELTATGLAEAAQDNPTRDDLPGFRDQLEIDPNLDLDTGISREDLMAAQFDGFENLPNMIAETGDVGGLLRPGTPAYEALMEEAARRVNNAQAAGGKLGSGQTVELMADALTRQRGNIEGINQSLINQELAQRRSDFALSGGKRQQLVGEQLSEADREFGQLSGIRDQIFRELLAEEGAEFGNTMAVNDQMFAQDSAKRAQFWQELLGLDAREFEKLMQVSNLGANAAARQGQQAASLSPQFSDALGAQLLGNLTGNQGRTNLIDNIVQSIFNQSGSGSPSMPTGGGINTVPGGNIYFPNVSYDPELITGTPTGG